MGVLKQLCIQYEIQCDDKNAEKIIFQKLLKSEVENILKNDKVPDNNKLKNFLLSVIPENTANKYYLFVSKDDIGITLTFKYQEYINAILKLANYKFNLFYTLTSFREWIRESGATDYKTLFVDIDDTIEDISDFGIEEIKNMLMYKYNVPEENLPDYVVKSGHGLHVIYTNIQLKCSKSSEKVV